VIAAACRKWVRPHAGTILNNQWGRKVHIENGRWPRWSWQGLGTLPVAADLINWNCMGDTFILLYLTFPYLTLPYYLDLIIEHG
jgi:hypothetical protein